MRLLLVAAASLLVAGSAAAQGPTRSQLPRMVVPDATLVQLAPGLSERFVFFSTADDAAASTPDPDDTGADLKRLGRLAGYVRGRNARGAFSAHPPSGQLSVGTSVILWRDASAAAAAIRRDTADGKRLRGKQVEGGLLVGFTSTRVPSLGAGATLVRIHARPTGGADVFNTSISFRVGQLRGNAVVGRSDRTNADRLALDLATQLRRRMLAATS